MRLFVTDTLGNPYEEEEYIPQILRPLGDSRRDANRIKAAGEDHRRYRKPALQGEGERSRRLDREQTEGQ